MILPARRDYAAGALCAALGLGTIVEANRYIIGTLSDMGPGFYPAVLGSIMTLMGVLIACAPATTEQADPLHQVPDRADWRGCGCIIAAVVLFILLDSQFGLVPAALASVFVAALGDRQATLLGSCVLAVCVTVFGAVLFRWLLNVDLPLW